MSLHKEVDYHSVLDDYQIIRDLLFNGRTGCIQSVSMDSPLNTEFLQRVATRGLMLSTELSSLVVKLVIGHIKPDQLCADVASTSALLQRLINEMSWNHEGAESIRLITPERIFAVHNAARSYENALDIIEVCFRGANSLSRERSVTVDRTDCLGSFVVREDSEDHLIRPDRLQDSLSEARQTFERIVKESGLQYSKTLDKMCVFEFTMVFIAFANVSAAEWKKVCGSGTMPKSMNV